MRRQPRTRNSSANSPKTSASLGSGPTASTVAEEPYTQVRRSKIHGRGLFATRSIPKGIHLGTYEGEVTKRDGCYVLWVENEARDGVYGVRGRNSLRFVNHDKSPNAEFDGEELHTLRRIQPEEEITVDYGPDWAE